MARLPYLVDRDSDVDLSPSRVRLLLHRLPADERRVLELRFAGDDGEGLSLAEVARRLRVSVGRVSHLERRGLDQLREILRTPPECGWSIQAGRGSSMVGLLLDPNRNNEPEREAVWGLIAGATAVLVVGLRVGRLPATESAMAAGLDLLARVEAPPPVAWAEDGPNLYARVLRSAERPQTVCVATFEGDRRWWTELLIATVDGLGARRIRPTRDIGSGRYEAMLAGTPVPGMQ